MLKSIKIGTILIFVSLLIFIFSFTTEKTLETKEIKEEEKKISEKIADETSYFAILEIPKINLKKELFSPYSKENNVDKNVYVHEISTFPNIKNSHTIIASHSGNGKNAYFKNLYKLQIEDEIILYYKNQKYTYKIEEIDYQKKTGELNIKRKANTLTLITCTKNNKKTQTIYYAKMV